jgi:hypothetical protein
MNKANQPNSRIAAGKKGWRREAAIAKYDRQEHLRSPE